MDATAPVSTASVPAPASGPAEARPAAQDSAPAQAAAPVEASSLVLSTSDAAKVILAQPPVQAPPAQAPPVQAAAAQVDYDPSPTAQQIQMELSQLLQQLDNQPEEHPNAPAVVLLQNKETALRAALTQVSLGTPGPGQAYLSGVVLNAAV